MLLNADIDPRDAHPVAGKAGPIGQRKGLPRRRPFKGEEKADRRRKPGEGPGKGGKAQGDEDTTEEGKAHRPPAFHSAERSGRRTTWRSRMRRLSAFSTRKRSLPTVMVSSRWGT